MSWDPKPVTPAPSGNTQTQMTLFGQRADKNGQPVTKAVGITPEGAVMMELTNTGLTGGYTFQTGDVIELKNGSIVGWFRGGQAVQAVPGVA